MRTMIVIGMAALISATGCNGLIRDRTPDIIGNGVSKSEERQLPDFHEVEVSDSFEVTITTRPSAIVILLADENLLPLIRTEVRDGRLIVDHAGDRGLRSDNPLMITIAVPRLDFIKARGASRVDAAPGALPGFRVEMEGASRATVREFTIDRMEVEGSGASHVSLIGRGKRLEITAQGASSVDAKDANFEEVRANLDGASRGQVSVSGSVEGALLGASSLRVGGAPKVRNVSTSGASSVSY